MATEKKTTPPYIPYSTFKNATTGKLVTSAGDLPSHIDSSVLPGMAGGTQAHYFVALRFFGLIDKEGRPSDRLRRMVSGDDGWEAEMKALLERHYSDHLPILPNGTPKKLRQSFDQYASSGSVIMKSVRFFVVAAEDAGFKVADSIQKSKGGPVPSRAGGGRRRRKFRDDDHDDERQTDPGKRTGMITYPLHFPGRAAGEIVVPNNITPDDIEVVKTMVTAIEIYANAQKGGE
ncbi:MAG: DUF5343 domain-containing protein [Planctomycetes bacterium]|nr:DUF5343 domain-containing protein [Planctomycetota bacterium]